MTFSNALESPAGGGATLLEARGLCKFYGTREVLHEVSFAIRPRESVTIVGPNGAGKTTLLKCLLGLETPDYGTVVRAADLRIGYVPQHFKPQPSMPMDVASFLDLYLDVPCKPAAETALTRNSSRGISTSPKGEVAPRSDSAAISLASVGPLELPQGHLSLGRGRNRSSRFRVRASSCGCILALRRRRI